MTILYVSDFDLSGSGYKNIAAALCDELTGRGHDIIALGLGYGGQVHHHPFKIVPARGLQYIIPMIQQFRQAEMPIEAVVVALDIPLQEALLHQLQAPQQDLPYIGIFPLEAPPLCGPWAIAMLRMSARLIMSHFGLAAMREKGVEGAFIPIGVDTESWRPPNDDERILLRQGMGVEDDTFVVLTVADNQERKNLSRSMEIFADFAQDRKAVYWLVTRPKSPVGWKLEDYAMSLGIMEKMMIWERGISFKQLWSLYAAADCMLLTSKAEGLAMPVLEAMACRLPVIGTKCAAIQEHLDEGRGLLIEPDYTMIDVWGNSNRYLAGREDGLYQMQLLRNGMSMDDINEMLTRAQEYVQARTWAGAVDVLEETIKRVGKAQAPIQEPGRELAEVAA